MSMQITTAFAQQFRAGIMHVAQEQGNELNGTVLVDPNMTGEKAFFDYLGAIELVDDATRHGDSPVTGNSHIRRMVFPTKSHGGDFVDRVDKVQTLNDPTNPYVQAFGMAWGRRMTQHILTAANGVAYTGKDGSTSTSLPAGQKVAIDYVESGSAANSGLTIAKLRQAKYILDSNKVDKRDRHIAVTAKQVRNLLQTTEVTSSDYNSVKALVSGEVDSFLGFKFHPTEECGLVTTAVQAVIAYQKTGIGLGIWINGQSRIAERADKSFSTYVYYSGFAGATRLEEEKVVEIACDIS